MGGQDDRWLPQDDVRVRGRRAVGERVAVGVLEVGGEEERGGAAFGDGLPGDRADRAAATREIRRGGAAAFNRDSRTLSELSTPGPQSGAPPFRIASRCSRT